MIVVFGFAVVSFVGICVSFMLIAFARELAFAQQTIAWCDEREEVFREVFAAVRAVEGHKYTTDELPPESGYTQRSGRMIYYEGRAIPYQMLIDMIMIEQDQRGLLAMAMDHAHLWELEHPLPSPPLYFGRRVPIH